jgi:peptide/nickel transport system ATP-binding protein
MMSRSGGDLVLEVEGLHVSFPTDDGSVDAVRGVSYSLAPGEALGIVGESGSGKSVTSLAIMGLLPRTASVRGEVRLAGSSMLGLNDAEISALRGDDISMVFQDPLSSLTPVYTVGQHLVEAIRAHRDATRAEARETALRLLETVGIPSAERRLDAYPHELSGGMRQRVVIAIAIANDPAVIIADEPTTALDVTVQAQILDALAVARRETHAALVLITHDLGVVAGQVDRVGVMYAGRIVEMGPIDEVFREPLMPYTVGLLGSIPRLDRDRTQALTPIPGTPPSLLEPQHGCAFAPRCPLVRDRCRTESPQLRAVRPSRLAACHFAEDVAAASATDLFAPIIEDTIVPSEERSP